MINRNVLSDEKDIFKATKEKLKSEGIDVSITQIAYLYTIIIKFIREVSTIPKILGIVLPKLGTLYPHPREIKKEITKSQKRDYDKKLVLNTKLGEIKDFISSSDTLSRFSKTRLRKRIRLTNRKSFRSVIENQNKDYDRDQQE